MLSAVFCRQWWHAVRAGIVAGALVVPFVWAPTSKAAESTVAHSDADSLYYSQPDKSVLPTTITLSRPPLQALITIDSSLDPFRLDATMSRQVGLADVLGIALANNLNIQISHKDMDISKWKLLNAYSQFLPQPHLGYMWNYADGHIRLPITLPGAAGSAGVASPLRIDSPFIIARAGVEYHAFRGGKVLFTALQSRNNLHSTRWRFQSTTNDVLLESSNRYYDLVLNEALLQIRIRAVATSEEQLRLNLDLEKDGMATRLDVLQARTQLADDRQNLIEQQIARRNSAIRLAEYLNFDQSTDLEPIISTIQTIRLIDEKMPAGKLLAAAMNTRPELKSYREQVLAARKGIMIAAAPLYPTVDMNATEFGIGETLTNKKRLVTDPLTGARVSQSRQITGLGVVSLNANWTLAGFGTTDFTNIQTARQQARQTMLQSNQEANAIISQVRQAYLNQLSALRRTEQNQARIESSAEELRLAQLRLQSGLGRNIDILRAQQDLTTALVQHAQSAIEFNKAQIQLLHDIGLISPDRVLSSTPLSL